MPNIVGLFTLSGGRPVNGATVHLYSAGVSLATSPPQKDTPLPASAPIASTTTGPQHGGDGQYRFTGLATGEYYVAVVALGHIVWDYYNVNTVSTVTGEVYSHLYPTIQDAINACPAGGTVVIPAGTYDIDQSYTWTHPKTAATMYGLVVLNKRVNLRGMGHGTLLRAAASNVHVLSYSSTAYLTQSDESWIQNIRFADSAPASHTGTVGVRLDYSSRLSVRNCFFDNFKSAGLLVKSSNIVRVNDCEFGGCLTAIDAGQDYAGNEGSHALQVRGGHISKRDGLGGYDYGIKLGDGTHGLQYVRVEGMTIQGMAQRGILFDGGGNPTGYGLTVDGCYFENTGAGIFDVELLNGWRNCRIDNAQRVKARNGYGLTLSNFWDAANHHIDVDSTVQNILIPNPWHQTGDTNADSRLEMVQIVDRGYGRLIQSGEPAVLAAADDDVGVNLIGNPGMIDSARGWTLSNMLAEATEAPFCNRASVKTNSGVAGTTCSATRAVTPAFHNDLRNRVVSLSAWVKVPGTTWTVSFELVDGDRSKVIPVPNAIFDNTWRRISARIRTGTAATGISVRVRLVVGSGLGTAYVTGVTLSLGNIPLRPALSEVMLPTIHEARRINIRSTQSIAGANELDPGNGYCQKVQGSGGPITIGNVSNALAGFGTTWGTPALDGMSLRLVGASATNTLTLTGGTTARMLLGAATRTLALNSVLELMFDNNQGMWIEVFWKP